MFRYIPSNTRVINYLWKGFLDVPFCTVKLDENCIMIRLREDLVRLFGAMVCLLAAQQVQYCRPLEWAMYHVDSAEASVQTLKAPCGLWGCKNRHSVSWPDVIQGDQTRLCLSCLLAKVYFDVFVVLLTRNSFLCCVIYMLFVCSVARLFLIGCRYQCK